MTSVSLRPRVRPEHVLTATSFQIISHDGGIPGFVAELMILPGDNLAIIALLNTDAPIQDVLPLAIISSVLELNTTSTSSPQTGAVSRRTLSARATSPAENCTKSSLALEKFAGRYTSPAYGNLTFCAPTSTNTSQSAYCNSTLSDFASLAPLDPNTLYAVTNRLATHVSMQRTCAGSDNAFVVSFQSIYPNGYGRNTTAFTESFASVIPDTHVECVAENGRVTGCGWLDLEVSPIKLVGTAQERAQIWWTKQG